MCGIACVCVCVCECVYVCVCLSLWGVLFVKMTVCVGVWSESEACIRKYMCVCVSENVYLCVFQCGWMGVYMPECLRVCTHTCARECVYVCVCVCVCEREREREREREKCVCVGEVKAEFFWNSPPDKNLRTQTSSIRECLTEQ